MKTKFDSFCLNGLPDGCKQCVKGKKLVLFVGGECSRKCWYCSLSESRKNCKQIFVNERVMGSIKDLFLEIKESRAEGMGVTGGDPLVNFKKTINILKQVRKKYQKKFHIHIYLPLNLVNGGKIKALKGLVDEVRFHPSFLFNQTGKLFKEEINKINNASNLFGRKNVGIEMPMIPGKEDNIYDFIKEIKDFIGFVNLNEFELSETNFNRVTNEYSLNEDSYTVFDSLNSGKKILRMAKKDKLKIKIHLCSAKTKDFHQYRNRLLRHEILPYGNRLKNGNVVYFAVYDKPSSSFNKISEITLNCFLDRSGKRVLIKMADVLKVYEKLNLKIARVVEQPVFGKERVEFSWIGED